MNSTSLGLHVEDPLPIDPECPQPGSIVAAAGTGVPTAAFERVVEAAILMSGLGFESGGLSVAHALTRGLSVLPKVKHAPHGLQVAYGLLVQLELESRANETIEKIAKSLTWQSPPTTMR